MEGCQPAEICGRVSAVCGAACVNNGSSGQAHIIANLKSTTQVEKAVHEA